MLIYQNNYFIFILYKCYVIIIIIIIIIMSTLIKDMFRDNIYIEDLIDDLLNTHRCRICECIKK